MLTIQDCLSAQLLLCRSGFAGPMARSLSFWDLPKFRAVGFKRSWFWGSRVLGFGLGDGVWGVGLSFSG